AVVYGLGPVMKTDYRYLTVPNKYCLQAVRGEPLEVYAGAATPTAFIHLDDACAALEAAAAAPWPAGFHVANAAGEVCTVPEVARVVAEAGAVRGLRVAAQDGGPSGSQGAGEAAARVVVRSRLAECGWGPTRTLADSVGEMLDYFRAR